MLAHGGEVLLAQGRERHVAGDLAAGRTDREIADLDQRCTVDRTGHRRTQGLLDRSIQVLLEEQPGVRGTAKTSNGARTTCKVEAQQQGEKMPYSGAILAGEPICDTTFEAHTIIRACTLKSQRRGVGASKCLLCKGLRL